MTIYRHNGREHVSDGWINPNDIERRFLQENIPVMGHQYDGTDPEQKEQLFQSIITFAGALCTVKLLERRRQMMPPSLDYRVTKLGRKVDCWGYGLKPGLRKRSLFFAIEAGFRLMRYWKLVALGAAGWAVLNAAKFYTAAFHWIANDLFAAVSFAVIAIALLAGRKALMPAD